MTYPVDDAGNVRVDFVWGHMPIQPDQGRERTDGDGSNLEVNGNWVVTKERGSSNLESSWGVLEFGTGDGDNFREQVYTPGYNDIATTGYSNFPAFLPNYAGDGDAQLEAIIPDISKLTAADAETAISALGIYFNYTTTYVGATLANDGKWKSQSVPTNAALSVGDTVSAVYYEAPTVPNVVDFDSVSAAQGFLEDRGLVLGTVTTSTVGATSGNNNWVKSQSIAAGTKVAAGTAVNLVEYDYVEAPAPSTTGPISGFNRLNAGSHGWSLNGSDSIMYLLGRTVRPTIGDTINVTGTSNGANFDRSWIVADIANDDSYNTGGTAVKVTVVSGANTGLSSTGGTWTKL